MKSDDPEILGSVFRDSNYGAKIFFALVVIGVIGPIAWTKWHAAKSDSINPKTIIPKAEVASKSLSATTSTNRGKPPILAESSPYTYGGSRDRLVGFEGKIYNPNSFPVTNVRVRWKVYKTPAEKDAELWERFGFEESCGFEFAFIPPMTTYDFKTEKIKLRHEDVVRSLGLVEAPMTDLKPRIEFSSDH